MKWNQKHCFLLLLSVFSILGSALYSVESGNSQVTEIKYRVTYAKFLLWLMMKEQLPIEDGLPWCFEIVEEVESMVDNLSQENPNLHQYQYQ